MGGLTIRRAAMADAEAIADIYNHYVETSTATFDTVPATPGERAEWLAAHDDEHPVLVADRVGDVVGWGSITAWGQRPGWRHTVEVGIYVRPGETGAGVGSNLLEHLVEAADAAGHHALLAQVVSDNTASLALFERGGFERVGTLAQVGRKFDRWIDLVILERISKGAMS